MERRRFILKAGGALATAGAAAVVEAPNVIAQAKIQWRLSTAYPASLDVLHGSAQRLATVVEEMSGGRFRIEVFPGGQIMPPFECFDAASKGTDIQAFMAAPVYWFAKEPAIEWFGTVPFGMNPEGMTAWYHQGDGLKLWEETYAAFNLVPRQRPAFAPQMGGWFKKKINTIGEYKGLKVRHGEQSGPQAGHQSGCHRGPHPGRRHLCRARAGRDRRRGVGRAVRRHEARPPPDGAKLLLPGLAGYGRDERV